MTSSCIARDQDKSFSNKQIKDRVTDSRLGIQWKKKLGLPVSADWPEESKETKHSVAHKMAAGRKFRQHEKSLHNFTWYYREKQKLMQYSRAPGAFPDCRAPVIFTGFSPLVPMATLIFFRTVTDWIKCLGQWIPRISVIIEMWSRRKCN